jgi:hypothetical protein
MHSLAHVKHSQACGGGRGVFARGFIRAGTVVLTEIPRVTLSDEECSDAQLPMHVSYARAILSGACGAPGELLEQMGTLHPVSIGDVPQNHYAALLEEYSPHFDMLFASAAEHGCKVSSRDQLFLLLCRLRFNCFSSGLYLNSSLVNHSCNPNCSKFSRTHTAFSLPLTEFVATRDISEGEEITITYFGNVELSHRSRSMRFLAQHCAQLPPSPFPHPLDHLPEGVHESEVEALELQLDSLASTIHSSIEAGDHSVVAQLRSLHARAASLCGQGHFVSLRILRMLVSANAVIISNCSSGHSSAVSLALHIVRDGLHLLPLMESYVKPFPRCFFVTSCAVTSAATTATWPHCFLISATPSSIYLHPATRRFTPWMACRHTALPAAELTP